jgi:quinol monooxygenase YgiN
MRLDELKTTMAITRINEFKAPDDKASELGAFLGSVIALILGAPGCRSCQLLHHHEDATRYAIIEVWDSIEAHQAAASRIPPDLMQKARTLFAEPARGAYYDGAV